MMGDRLANHVWSRNSMTVRMMCIFFKCSVDPFSVDWKKLEDVEWNMGYVLKSW